MRFHRINSASLVLALSLACLGCVQTSAGSFVSLGGSEHAQRVDSLPLELRAGDTLNVELVFGDIAVGVSDTEAAHVEASWHASANEKADAEAVLARYRLEFTRDQDRGCLSVRVAGDPLEVSQGGSTLRLAASVDLRLVLPSSVHLLARSESGDLSASGALASCTLQSSYGDVAATGVRGATTITTASGTALLESIEAPSAEARSQYGDLRAVDVRATRVHLETSSGDVSASRIEGSLTISSSYGDLAIEGSRGDLDASTSSGDIVLGSPLGTARRRLLTSYGDVRAQGAQGDLEAATSSGAVAIDACDGAVRAASTYGDVSVQGRFSQVQASTGSGAVVVDAAGGSSADGDWLLNSNYGDVRLWLPAGFECTLRAGAPRGDLSCDFAHDLRSSGGKPLREIQIDLGKGGKRVEVRAESGDVSIARRQ